MKLETIAIVFSLLFMIAISLYHVSYDGYLGMSLKFWESVWVISNNGILLTMSFVTFLYSFGLLRSLILYVFMPYFVLKLVYQFSVYSEIYIFHPLVWEKIWSLALVLLIIASLIIILTKIKNA